MGSHHPIIARRMKEKPDNSKWELAEFEHAGEKDIDRMVEELNVLRLEGSLFCLNPRKRKKAKSPITLNEMGGQSITIEPHPNYGQPSVLAYRILQAVFIKMTMEGYPYPDTVSFTMRELTRMVEREWSGSKGTSELYNAIMQLRTTIIHCALKNKSSDEWDVANFNMFAGAGFSVKRATPKACVIEIDRRIAQSLNLRHVAFFNLGRLNILDVIGMVMYKRLFFHLANLYNPGKGRRQELSFCKDYEAICREWLGGLKPERYKSKIISNQLGRHIEGLKRTQLIRRCDIEKKVDGSGFKMTFYPGACCRMAG